MKLPIYELRINENLSDDAEVSYIALVDVPAIQKDFLAFNDEYPEDIFLEFAEDLKHYTKDGVLWTGPTHQDVNGRLMTGATHTEDSEYLYHEGEYAEIGPRGGVRESDKAPKSGTKNDNPKGEGSAKGDASGKRGAKVTEAQEKTLQNKADEFNEKESNTKNGRATLGALKSVFQRGLGAFNTSHSPKVRSAEQWAYARVNAFLYLLKNGRPENPKYNTDYDLLPKDHPKNSDKMSAEFAETYNDYPEQASENAKIALRYAEEYGWGDCGTPVGKARANQLANGDNISRDTIARMASFERQRQNSDKELGDGCGRLMWLAWGGDAGVEWAQRKLEQIDKMRLEFKIVNEEQRIISGPLMLADDLIYRKNEKMGEHYVKFSADTIKAISIKFAKKKYQNHVNLMHDPEKKVKGVTMFESFLVDSKRGIQPMKGFEGVADGSWFGSFYVENMDVWNQIKKGEFKGFSVEGIFDYEQPITAEENALKKISELLNVINHE